MSAQTTWGSTVSEIDRYWYGLGAGLLIGPIFDPPSFSQDTTF